MTEPTMPDRPPITPTTWTTSPPVAGSLAVASDATSSPGSSRWRTATSYLPAALAVLFFVAFSALVLSQAERMIEPDPYAYRASIAALEQGDLTLSQAQYDDLSSRLQQTSLGGGIMQWHQDAAGTWVSEKNPGYPFLVVGFDEAGALRIAPLFYGALACLALWFGAREWLGRWGGTFAVGAYCSAAISMVMAWRSTMPTFTDASLVGAGLGLLVWGVVALDRSRRARTIVGALAFLSFGLAVFVRYTNIAVLAVAAVFALFVCLRPKWRLGWSTLVWWAIASIPPLLASLAYNAAVFDGPFSTGYAASSVQFSLGAIPDNLDVMPSHLWRAMPVFVIGLVAILVLVGFQIRAAVRQRRANAAIGDTATTDAENVDDGTMPTSVADRWIGLFLVASWAAVWVLYAAYEWTARMGGATGGPGGGGPAGLGGGGGSGFSQPTYSIVRFYLPALGAIALLVAWLFTRMPAVIGVLAIFLLFVVGGNGFLSTVDSQWAHMSVGGGQGSTQSGIGGPGGPGGRQDGSNGRPQFDPSKCPNLPTPPQGGAGPGNRPGQGQGQVPDGNQLPGPGAGGGLTFDENGCPILLGSSTSTATTATTSVPAPQA